MRRLGLGDELAQIEARASAPDFWNNQIEAQKILQRRRRVEEEVELIAALRAKTDDLGVLLDWAGQGEDVAGELSDGIEQFAGLVEGGEIKKMLGGEHDRKNAIITIHPGAGGTESQDWAEMLLRMYLRWIERRGFKREVIDYQPGDEAGLKSATADGDGRVRVRTAVGRGRRPPAGAHFAVRSGRAPPHVVRVGLRLAGAAGG